MLLKSTELAIIEAIAKRAMGIISSPRTPAIAAEIEVKHVIIHIAMDPTRLHLKLSKKTGKERTSGTNAIPPVFGMPNFKIAAKKKALTIKHRSAPMANKELFSTVECGYFK